MIKGYLLRVRRNESVSSDGTYPAWEKTILEAVHPETTVLKEVTLNRPAPIAEEEFVRLENRYKMTTNEDGSKGPSFVSAVYGHANGGGIQRLQEVIDEATVAEVDETEGLMGEATA